MLEKGFLILSDISGYTAYLTKSELDHAQGTLSDLLNAMIDSTTAPQVISKLEGDAIFSYAPQGSYTTGHTIVEGIENIYFAFRHSLRRININTTCPCQACVNIPSLDLKFFIHFGEYGMQKLGIQTELVGSDVNLAHRLMKNNVTETTGMVAYAMYTQAAMDALDIPGLSDAMTQHMENYEHLGDVNTYLVDMHKVWEQDEARRRIAISPEDALGVTEAEIPYKAGMVWQVLTDPKYRKDVLDADTNTVDALEDGRMGPGAVYHCAHGDATITHTVLDWNPFSYYTFESYDHDLEMTLAYTFHLKPVGDSTHLMMTLGIPGGHSEEVHLKYQEFSDMLDKQGQFLLGNIQSVLERVVNSNEILDVEGALFSADDVLKAAAESLAV